MTDRDFSFLLSLMRSGKYSDFALVCEGKSFNLHQAVVCPQSSVISAALDGNFKVIEESATKIIEVESFDLPSVERMIEFFYSRTYSVEVGDKATESLEVDTSNTRSDDESAQQDDDSAHTNAVSELPGNPLQTDESEEPSTCKPEEQNLSKSMEILQDTLLCHIRVNIIADYYNIQGLAQLSKSNLQRILEKEWHAGPFSVAAKEAINSSGDQELHQLIKSLAVTHIDELVTVREFADLGIFSELGFEILRDSVVQMAKNISELQTKMTKAEEGFEIDTIIREMEVAESQRETQEEKNRCKNIIHNIDICREKLADTSRCRHCDEPFNCYIESHGSASRPQYTLRCSHCRCRH